VCILGGYFVSFLFYSQLFLLTFSSKGKMNIKLVEHLRKLNEEDLFPNASKEDLIQREKARPSFICPNCKQKIDVVSVVIEKSNEGITDIDPNGHIQDYEFHLSQLNWTVFCPKCKKRIHNGVEPERANFYGG
jgi:uncharacterized protein YlaI